MFFFHSRYPIIWLFNEIFLMGWWICDFIDMRATILKKNIRLSGPWKTSKGVWPSWCLSGPRLKNSNAELSSRSLELWICKASVASIYKLCKARGCFEGSRQCILSREKTTSWQIPNETIWPRKLLPKNMTNKHNSMIILILLRACNN